MMKPKAFSELNWSVFTQFCGRKKIGHINVVTDVQTKLVYPIPIDEEHKTFVPRIIGFDLEMLRADSTLFRRFIPTVIATEFDEVTGVRTGFSGLESGFNVKHSPVDLEVGHALAKAFIGNGEVTVSENFKDYGIDYRYSDATLQPIS
jgi:hypothetical protein